MNEAHHNDIRYNVREIERVIVMVIEFKFNQRFWLRDSRRNLSFQYNQRIESMVQRGRIDGVYRSLQPTLYSGSDESKDYYSQSGMTMTLGFIPFREILTLVQLNTVLPHYLVRRLLGHRRATSLAATNVLSVNICNAVITQEEVWESNHADSLTIGVSNHC